MELKDYIFLGILVILIILVVILILKSNKDNSGDFSMLEESFKKANYDQEKRILDDNSRLKNDVSQIQLNTNKELMDFKENLNKSIDERFQNLNKVLQEGILNISKEMNKNVSDNFEKTNQTFSDIRERIAKIDEAQKSLQSVETSIDSFKEVLENKKMRGNFGEFQLNTILVDMFGEKKENYYIQHKLSNGYIADACLKLPEPLGLIVIDSKFPLDNYKKIYDSLLAPSERDGYKKLFKDDIKKHINDISTKYIVKNETSNQAMMFVPSEAVFAEIQGNNPDLVEFARKQNVWIASPTTLMAILETTILVLRDEERSKSAKKILEELNKLADDFERYEKRWKDFEKHLNQVVDDADKINKSTVKITNKFKIINKTSVDSIEYKDELDDLEEEIK